MNNKPENSGSSRREFLRNAAATAAVSAGAATVAKSSVYSLAPARVLGAADRINLAHIGLGTQGFGAHTRLFKQYKAANNTESVAICDLYGWRQRRAANEIGDLKESNWYWDYKKLLERKDVDAVVVATSDNWHAPIVIDALAAGKHVYCEKPMCKTVDETFAIYDAVKKSGRKLQVGSQGCSDLKWHRAGQLVKEGKIGRVVVGQGSYMRNGRIGEWNNYGENPYQAPHKNAGPNGTGDMKIDWETFRKGAGPKEFDPDRFFRWRKYWAYGSGLVGDLFPHRLHPLFLAMAIPYDDPMKGWPIRVSSGGGLYVQKVNPDTGKPDRDVPDFINISADYEAGTMMAMSSTINEQGWPDCVRGNKATIYFGGTTVETKVERVWADEIDAMPAEQAGDGEHIEVHEKNWLDCIRNGKEPNCNIDIAARVSVMICLGELAERYNTTFTFDPKTRKATPDSGKYNAA